MLTVMARSGALRSILLFLVGLLILVAYILLFIDYEKLVAMFLKIGPCYYLVAIGVDLLYMLSYSLAWHAIVTSFDEEISVKDSVTAVLISIYGDILIPTASIAGEALRVAYAKKKMKLPMSHILSTIAVHRLLNLYTFVTLVLVCTAVLFARGELPPQALGFSLTMLVISIPLLIVLTALLLNVGKASGAAYKILFFLEKRGHKRLSKALSKALEEMERIQESMDSLKRKRYKLFVAYMLLIIQWVLGSLIPYVFFRALGYEVDFLLMVLAFPLYGLIALVPVGIPGMLGVMDVSMISTFVLLGLDKEMSTAVAISTRLIIVVFELVFTGLITWLKGVKEIASLEES